jgi:hypothetical protein
MRHSSRSTVALCLVAALVTALQGWVQIADRAGIAPPPILGRLFLRTELENYEAGRQRVTDTTERRRRAQDLAGDVAEGRVTLHDGAGRLRELFRTTPDFPWAAVERKYPGISDEERCCRLLIAEVARLPDRDPEQARAAVRRLEADLEREFHTDGIRQAAQAAPPAPEALSRATGKSERPTSTPADKT